MAKSESKTRIPDEGQFNAHMQQAKELCMQMKFTDACKMIKNDVLKPMVISKINKLSTTDIQTSEISDRRKYNNGRDMKLCEYLFESFAHLTEVFLLSIGDFGLNYGDEAIVCDVIRNPGVKSLLLNHQDADVTACFGSACVQMTMERFFRAAHASHTYGKILWQQSREISLVCRLAKDATIETALGRKCLTNMALVKTVSVFTSILGKCHL